MSDVDEEILVYGPKVNTTKNEWSVGKYFYQRLMAGGDKIAQIIEDDGDGEEGVLAYSDILRSGKVVAGLLRRHGLSPKDTVMSVTGNTLEYAPIFWGTQFVGATIAPVNSLHEFDDILRFIKTVLPKVIFCNEQAEANVRNALAEYGDQRVLLITLDELLVFLQNNPSDEGFYLGSIEDPDTQIALALFTAGASGTPKCVEITHSTIMRQMDLNQSIYRDKVQEQEVCVNIAGPSCISGTITNLQAINASETCLLVPNETFTGIGFLNVLEKYKVNFVSLSPRHLISMVKCLDAGTHDLSHVQSCLVGGAPVSWAMVKLASAKLRIKVIPEYVLTEIIRVCDPADPQTERPGTVGKLAENVVAKIIDVDTGKSLGPGELGELLVRSIHGLSGYRNDPEATATTIDKDGFLNTGDIAYYDEDGYFYVMDRLTEHIKYKNELIAPVDIEVVLLRHIKVQEACVIGVHRESECQATAIVVVKKGETLMKDELVTLVRNRLPESKWLRGGVIFADSLPYSLNARINRRLLRDAYESGGDL